MYYSTYVYNFFPFRTFVDKGGSVFSLPITFPKGTYVYTQERQNTRSCLKRRNNSFSAIENLLTFLSMITRYKKQQVGIFVKLKKHVFLSTF